jgi:hypothetical protein
MRLLDEQILLGSGRKCYAVNEPLKARFVEE